jgi:hypothetical protein
MRAHAARRHAGAGLLRELPDLCVPRVDAGRLCGRHTGGAEQGQAGGALQRDGQRSN